MSEIQLFLFFSLTTPHWSLCMYYNYCSDETEGGCARAGSQIRGDVLIFYSTSPWPQILQPLSAGNEKPHKRTHIHRWHINEASVYKGNVCFFPVRHWLSLFKEWSQISAIMPQKRFLINLNDGSTEGSFYLNLLRVSSHTPSCPGLWVVGLESLFSVVFDLGD